MRFLAAIGATVLGLLAAVGRVTLYAVQTLSHPLRPPFYFRELAVALLNIGWLSLPVVGLTAIFTGGALALQIWRLRAHGSTPKPWCHRSLPSAWCANWAPCWWA